MGNSVTIGLYYGFAVSGEVDADELIERLETDDSFDGRVSGLRR